MKKIILLSILSIMINIQLMADNCLKTSDKISMGVVSAAQASVMGPVGALWSVGVLSYLYSYENPSSCPDGKTKPVKEIKKVEKVKVKPVIKVKPLVKVKPVIKVKPLVKVKPVIKVKPVVKVKPIEEPVRQIRQYKEPVRQIRQYKEPVRQIRQYKEPVRQYNKQRIYQDTSNCGDRVYKNFVSFDYDSYDISTYPSIDLSNDRIKSIRIEGNTDKYGNKKYNKILGLVRAMVVKELLIENNIDKNKLSVVSNGSKNPISNDNTENRRVDLIITYYKTKKYNTKKYTNSMQETIYKNFVSFDNNSYGINTLPFLLDNLLNDKIKSIRIEGNTDKFGSSRYNEKLGKNRANAVRKLLIENNIDARKLSIVSNASRNPISNNNAKNRRVDLIVTYYKENIKNNHRMNRKNIYGSQENKYIKNNHRMNRKNIYGSQENIYNNFVNFKYNSYDIDTFPSLLDNLSNNRIRSIRIEGNTDNHGTIEYNKMLGLNRAMAVKELLIQNNIDEFKLSIVSNGKKNPISNYDKQNRRVDLIITYYK